MPNRILRDYTDSAPFDGLSAEAERLFVRLLTKADDFGRFHANPKLVKAACFPLAEDLRANTVAAWLTELSDRQLVFCYTSGTESYLAFPKFRQRTRADASKFPQPDGEPPDWMPPDDRQVTVTRQSPAHVFGDVCEVGDGDGKAVPLETALAYARGAPILITGQCVEAWHDDRIRAGWRYPKGGRLYPIPNDAAGWQSDLRTFARSWKGIEDERKAMKGNGGGMTDKTGTRWTSTQ